MLEVTRWVDYASKYGVGYMLSDGSVGVYFNDSTKIILEPSGLSFDYITRRTQEKPEDRSTYSWEKHPEELKKKVLLLRNFKNYMTSDTLERKVSAVESSRVETGWCFRGDIKLETRDWQGGPSRRLGSCAFVAG